MAELIIKDDKEEKEKKEVEKKEVGWFERIPLYIKVLFIVFYIFLFLRLKSRGASINEFLLWLIGGFIVLYLLGTTRESPDKITAREAIKLTRKEIEDYGHIWDIPETTNYNILYSKPQFVDGRGKYFEVGGEFTDIDQGKRYFVSEVDFTKGLQGIYPLKERPDAERTMPKRTIIPQKIKDIDRRPWLKDFFK